MFVRYGSKEEFLVYQELRRPTRVAFVCYFSLIIIERQIIYIYYFYIMWQELSDSFWKAGDFIFPIANSSTSNVKSAFGGIAPGAPRAP